MPLWVESEAICNSANPINKDFPVFNAKMPLTGDPALEHPAPATVGTMSMSADKPGEGGSCQDRSWGMAILLLRYLRV